jgi:hypothetical protein
VWKSIFLSAGLRIGSRNRETLIKALFLPLRCKGVVSFEHDVSFLTPVVRTPLAPSHGQSLEMLTTPFSAELTSAKGAARCQSIRLRAAIFDPQFLRPTDPVCTFDSNCIHQDVLLCNLAELDLVRMFRVNSVQVLHGIAVPLSCAFCRIIARISIA